MLGGGGSRQPTEKSKQERQKHAVTPAVIASAYHDGVEPGVGGNLELLVLGEGRVLVPLALQPVQVRVDHPGETKNVRRNMVLRKK